MFDIIADGKKILDASTEEYEKWVMKAFQARQSHFDRLLYCYSPTAYPYNIPSHRHDNPHNFASLSVTGTSCSLHCDHCDAKLLKGMEPTISPDALLHACQRVKERGGEGVLISGGSDGRGHVPLDRFIPVIKQAKQDLGLKVVVHTGLVSEETAMGLADAGIDAAMLDIIGSEQVASDVYHLENGPIRMAHSLDLLKAHGIPIAPHVLVGLSYGTLNGELDALQMIASREPDSLVIIALNPLPKTPMAEISPPSPQMIGRVITIARLGLPATPILLGCARPIGEHKKQTDWAAIQSGVNGIAYISQEGVDFAIEQGLTPVFKDVCCSLAPLDLAGTR